MDLFKKLFIGLVTGLVDVSNHTKCISLTNQKCTTQPTTINLHPNEYTQGLRYYPFVVNLDRCDVSNKTEDLNLSVLNMITGINESKTLTKHISCECKCKFDGRKYNSNPKWNNNKCRCKCKNPKKYCACKNDYIWNPATCSCKDGKYLATIIQ